MSGRVSISRKTAEALLSLAADHENCPTSGASLSIASLEEMRRALAPKKVKPWATSKKIKAAKKKTKRANSAGIRAVAAMRSGGRCENCQSEFSDFNPGEWDHFFGRGKAGESPETTWVLCRTCHRSKTNNFPSAAAWLRSFMIHADRLGHADAYAKTKSRLQFIQTRKALTEAKP